MKSPNEMHSILYMKVLVLVVHVASSEHTHN